MLTLRRNHAVWSLCLVAAVMVGCGGGDDGSGGAAAPGGGGEGAGPVENAGSITGRVAFAGTPPDPRPIDMRDEPVCAAKHSEPPVRQAVLVNDNGTLRNVFVWVKEGLSGPYPAPAGSPELDQEGCIYEPHVLAVRTGQTFVVRNSDAVLHNVNTRPSANRGFNISQPQAGMTSQRSFPTQEVMIPVQCDVHGWMQAYIAVVDHPYYAVTGNDGTFRIENLPPGDYVVETWHEEYGTQTQNVTVPPNGTAEAAFSYSAATASIVPLGAPVDLHDHGAAGSRVAHVGAR